MNKNVFTESIIGAVILSFENGYAGLEPCITISTKDKNKYMITVSNSGRFIITQVSDDDPILTPTRLH